MNDELNKDWRYWYTEAMRERVQRVELQRKLIEMPNAEFTTISLDKNGAHVQTYDSGQTVLITGTVYTIDSLDDAPNVDDENSDTDVMGTLRELKGKRVLIQITPLD